jgi:hypothetical protein
VQTFFSLIDLVFWSFPSRFLSFLTFALVFCYVFYYYFNYNLFTHFLVLFYFPSVVSNYKLVNFLEVLYFLLFCVQERSLFSFPFSGCFAE